MKKIRSRILAAGLTVLMVMSLVSGTSVMAAAKVRLSQTKVTVGIGENITVKVKNAGKKVSCRILSGKKIFRSKKRKKV